MDITNLILATPFVLAAIYSESTLAKNCGEQDNMVELLKLESQSSIVQQLEDNYFLYSLLERFD